MVVLLDTEACATGSTAVTTDMDMVVLADATDATQASATVEETTLVATTVVLVATTDVPVATILMWPTTAAAMAATTAT